MTAPNIDVYKLIDDNRKLIDAMDYSFLNNLTVFDFIKIVDKYEKKQFDKYCIYTPEAYLYRHAKCVVEYFTKLKEIEQHLNERDNYHHSVQTIAFNFEVLTSNEDERKTEYGYYKHYRKVINPNWKTDTRHFLNYNSDVRIFNIRDITNLPVEFQDDLPFAYNNYTYTEDKPNYNIQPFINFVEYRYYHIKHNIKYYEVPQFVKDFIDYLEVKKL
jgi:hypothetical protein